MGLLPVLLLPAYPILVFAAWRRRWILAATAAVIAGLHLTWCLPEIWPHDYAKSGGVPITIFSQNLLYTNRNSQEAARDIERDSPDVVLILELSHENLRPLKLALSPEKYPFSFVKPDTNGAFGIGLWSKYPMKAKQTWVAATPLVDAELTVDGQTIRFLGVHTVGPLTSLERSRWATELRWLAREVTRSKSGRLIIAGDFNATMQHKDFRRLLSAGLRDAHGAGGGWDPTWPHHWWWLPPVMRIDHVLASTDLGVAWQRVLTANGSDHSALLTRLQIPA